jgi:hypothetical protein
VSKKANETLHRSCWEVFLSGAPPTSLRASKAIERRGTGFEKQVLELVSGIERAFSKGPGEEPPTIERVRDQYVMALAAVYRFLMRVDPVHGAHFLRLGDAIAELNIGARSALLAPLKTKSNPIPPQVWHARASVVFAVNALVETGLEPLHAAKELLKNFPGIEKLAGKKSLNKNALAKTLLEWEKTFRSPSRRKDNEAAHMFKIGCKLIVGFRGACTSKEFKEMAYEAARDAERISAWVTSAEEE